MYLRTFTVRTFGPTSKVIWLPKAWGFKKGELVHIEAKINGKTWHDTCKVKMGGQSAVYVTIPHFWPVERGDLIDFGLVYATVITPPTVPEPESSKKNTDAEDEKDAYPGTVD